MKMGGRDQEPSQKGCIALNAYNDTYIYHNTVWCRHDVVNILQKYIHKYHFTIARSIGRGIGSFVSSNVIYIPAWAKFFKTNSWHL